MFFISFHYWEWAVEWVHEKPWRKIIPITLYNYKMFLQSISKCCTFFRYESGSFGNTAHTATLTLTRTSARTCTPINCRFYPNALCNFSYLPHYFFPASRSHLWKNCVYLHDFENMFEENMILSNLVHLQLRIRVITRCVYYRDFAACRLQLGLRKTISNDKNTHTFSSFKFSQLFKFRVNHIANQAE